MLVPVEAHDAMPSVLETAYLAAWRFASTVEGAALRPNIADFVVPDPMGALVVQPPQWDEADAARKARERFDRFAAEHRSTAAGSAAVPTFSWRAGPSLDDISLASAARLYDVTVLGRPGTGRDNPRMTTLETALFESGRPILVAPPAAPKSLGENMLIHWNGSTETARTIAFAMPFLKEAKAVTVLAVEGAMAPGPTVKEVVDYLATHGITANAVNMKAASGQQAGEMILAHAKRNNADLLVKGAYTQSRLRQMIFGGATSHILAAAEVAVIMAH
jgi:nucleotide-binding universal stress UspA family protein